MIDSEDEVYYHEDTEMVLNSDDEDSNDDELYTEKPVKVHKTAKSKKSQEKNYGEEDSDPEADNEEPNLLDIPLDATNQGFTWDARLQGTVNLSNQPGHPINIPINVQTESDLWHLYFPDSLLNTWVELTNCWFIDNKITRTRSNYYIILILIYRQ